MRKLFFTLMFASIAITANAKDEVLDIKHWKTNEGARVYFVEAEALPMLDVKVLFAAGAARDGEQFGIANYTNAMLDMGTKQRNADQIAFSIENLGASIGRDTDTESASVSLRTLTDRKLLSEALEVFTDVVSNPNFSNQEFDTVKELILTGIKNDMQSPAKTAAKKFYRELFGKHPYANSIKGEKNTVEKLTPNDLNAFYQQYYVANNAIIILVGDISKRKATQIAEKISKELKPGGKAKPIPAVAKLDHAKELSIKHPTTQTNIRMGAVGIKRKDPDYFPLLVANEVLGGGGLVSRLYQEVREKRGLSYGAYSYFNPMTQYGPFVISLSTRNEETDKAIEVVQDTLNTFVKKGISEKDLKAAKQNMIGAFPLRLRSNSALVSNLEMIAFYELPLNYLDTFRDNIDSLSREKVNDAIRRRIDPDKMLLIKVKP